MSFDSGRWNGSIVAPRRNGVLGFGNRGLKPTATIGCRSAAGTVAGGSLSYFTGCGVSQLLFELERDRHHQIGLFHRLDFVASQRYLRESC